MELDVGSDEQGIETDSSGEKYSFNTQKTRKLGNLMYKKRSNALTLSDVCERTNLVTRLQCQLAESTSVKGSIVIQYSVHLALNNLTNNDLEN